jgi:hypothetical protein
MRKNKEGILGEKVRVKEKEFIALPIRIIR